jgi:hypothetical protein
MSTWPDRTLDWLFVLAYVLMVIWLNYLQQMLCHM